MTSQEIRDQFRAEYLASEAFGFLVDQMAADHPELLTTPNWTTVNDWLHGHGLDLDVHQDITTSAMAVLREGVKAVWPTAPDSACATCP